MIELFVLLWSLLTANIETKYEVWASRGNEPLKLFSSAPTKETADKVATALKNIGSAEVRGPIVVFKTPGTATPSTLGKLSEKYESGGRGPGTVSTGKGDLGGVSYGTYQLSTALGQADAFVKKYYPDEFKDLKAGTAEFTKKWKELAAKDPTGLQANEHAYIKETHYDVQAAKLKTDLGLDISKRSAALRDVVWSVSVQHGPKSGLIVKALTPLLKDKKIEDLTDEEIIKAIYAERSRTNKDGGLVYFSKSPTLWDGLKKRFENEQKDALDMLKKETSTPLP